MTSSLSPEFTIPTSFPHLFLAPDPDPSAGAGAGAGQAGGGSSGSDGGGAGGDDEIDPDTVVDVDGEPVKIGTMADAHRASKNAGAVRAAARTLANARASDEDRRAAARVVALADGVKEDELEASIDQMLGEDEDEGDEPAAPARPRRKQSARRTRKDGDREDEGSSAKKLADLQETVDRDRAARLGERIKNAATEALHGVEGIEAFVAQMQKPRQVVGKDGKKRPETEAEVSTRVQKWYDRSVQTIISNSTRAMAEKKRQAGGRFDEAWIGEAAAAVATEEFDHLKSAVGEANLIGRSTETESEVSQLLSSAPPPRPAYKPGMTVSELTEMAQASCADAAARDAADSLNGGPTQA